MAEDDAEIVLLSEVKELLEAERDRRGELRYEQKLALEHAQRFARLSPKDAKKLFKELQKVDRVSAENAAKLVDMCPRHPEDVRAVFSKERFNLSEDDVTKILDTVAGYV